MRVHSGDERLPGDSRGADSHQRAGCAARAVRADVGLGRRRHGRRARRRTRRHSVRAAPRQPGGPTQTQKLANQESRSQTESYL